MAKKAGARKAFGAKSATAPAKNATLTPPPSLELGGTQPLFDGVDPALGLAVYRQGGEVVLKFDKRITELRLTKDNAVLLRDHINLQQKHLGQQKGK